MDDLFQFDQWLFHKVNLDWSFPFGDIFFSWITDFHKTSLFIYGILPSFLVLAIWHLRKRSLEMFLAVAVALLLTDFIAGVLIKPFVGRLRPIISEADAIKRAEIFGRLSFPSNHAANSFCAAVVLSFYFPRLRWAFLLWAFLIAYSRPYVGAHYPGDCLAGAIFGTLIGLIVVFGVKKKNEQNLSHWRKWFSRNLVDQKVDSAG